MPDQGILARYPRQSIVSHWGYASPVSYKVLPEVRCSISRCLQHLQFGLQHLIIWGTPEVRGCSLQAGMSLVDKSECEIAFTSVKDVTYKITVFFGTGIYVSPGTKKD